MVILGVMGLALLCLAPAWAGDGALDPTFNNLGAGVQKLPVIRGQASYPYIANNSIIFGFFNSVGGVSCNSVARVNNKTGVVDGTFTPAVTGEVRSAYTYSSTDPNYGKILIAGSFSITSGPDTYYNLARLTSTGALDTTFTKTFYPTGAVNTIGVQQDLTGNILVGGYSMTVPGDTTKAYHLLLLNGNGTVVPSSTFTGWSAPGGYVSSVKVFSSDDTAYVNQARIFCTTPKTGGGTNYMVFLDTNFTTVLSTIGDETVDGPIFNMAQQRDNKWMIVGNFKNVKVLGTPTPVNSVARLGEDMRTLDPSYNIGSGPNGVVTQITPMSTTDDRMVLSGGFTNFNTTACGYLVRLETSGSVDPTFNNLGSPGTGADDRIMRSSGGSGGWTIFGYFRSYNGSANPRGGVASLDGNGNLIASPGLTISSNTAATVNAMEWDQTGFLIGGDFTGVGGKFHQNLARLHWDGSVDPSFTHNVDGIINSLRSNSNQMILAGNFGAADGFGRASLTRLNMDSSVFPNVKYSLDTSFNPLVTKVNGTLGTVMIAEVDDVAPYKIIVGGHFDFINGVSRTAVARLLSTGALDTNFYFDPATVPLLSNIRVNAGGNMGDVYPMVGRAIYNSSVCGFGWRLTSAGALDTNFGPTGSATPIQHVALFNGEVRCGTDQFQNQIVVGGDFTQTIAGSGSPITLGHIARFTANGLYDTTFNANNLGANGRIHALTRQENNKILIGGSFTQYNGIDRNSVARLNPGGSLDTIFNPGSGANGTIYMINMTNANSAFIGGSFTSYNGTPMGLLARIIAHGNNSPVPYLYLLLLGD